MNAEPLMDVQQFTVGVNVTEALGGLRVPSPEIDSDRSEVAEDA
ncbi:hypothetical protein ACW73L_03770 [Methylolobus aquaticus]